MTSTAAMAISADSDDRRRRFPPFPPFREFRLVEITLNWLDMSLLSGCTRIASKSAALKSRCLDIRTDGQKELNMTEEPVHEGLLAPCVESTIVQSRVQGGSADKKLAPRNVPPFVLKNEGKSGPKVTFNFLKMWKLAARGPIMGPHD